MGIRIMATAKTAKKPNIRPSWGRTSIAPTINTENIWTTVEEKKPKTKNKQQSKNQNNKPNHFNARETCELPKGKDPDKINRNDYQRFQKFNTFNPNRIYSKMDAYERHEYDTPLFIDSKNKLLIQDFLETELSDSACFINFPGEKSQTRSNLE